MAVYDVLVIGAGPAGGSAALHAAQGGLQTMILEEHPAVGEPVHCGECLSQLALERTGLNPPDEVISCRVKGVRVIFPSRAARVVNEPGAVLEKHRFEQWLIGQAVAAGAQLNLNTRVAAMQRSHGLWKIDALQGRSYRARVVIDASGVASVASTLLGLNRRTATTVGLQYELHDIPRDGYLDFYLWPEHCGKGYLWMIPKSNGRANVGLMTDDNGKAKTRLLSFLHQMGWQDKPRTRAFGGRMPADGPVAQTFADGLLLVGDAAGFTSPIFEGGTQLGLVSGRLAAQTAAEAISQGDCSTTGLARYERRWRGEFPDYARLLKGKRALHSFSLGELNLFASLLPRELGSVNLLDRIRIVLRLLRFPGLARKGAYGLMQALYHCRAEYYGW